MRWTLLLFSLAVAGCASTDDSFFADPPPSSGASASAAPAAAGTSAAPAAASTPAPQAAAAPMTPQQRLNQVRADCWMKVERIKTARTIDQRIAFVDKCVAEQSKMQ